MDTEDEHVHRLVQEFRISGFCVIKQAIDPAVIATAEVA
jgi:hypothetical protein